MFELLFLMGYLSICAVFVESLFPQEMDSHADCCSND
jgi:hypothetical protein